MASRGVKFVFRLLNEDAFLLPPQSIQPRSCIWECVSNFVHNKSNKDNEKTIDTATYIRVPHAQTFMPIKSNEQADFIESECGYNESVARILKIISDIILEHNNLS